MKASAQSTSHGGWAERNPAGAVTCGLLLSLILSCWLARERVGGGRGWCGGRQSCLAGLQVYLHPASRRSGRGGGAAFRAGSHTSTWLSVGLRFFSSKLHVCEKEGKPRLTPQRQHTYGSHFNCTPRLAVLTSLCFDNTCWRQRPPRDVHTVSQVYQTMPEWLGTRERRSATALALEEQTGVPGAQIPIRLSKMTTKMTRKRLLCFPIFNYSGPSKVTSLFTACNRGSLLLRRLAQDKGQSY